MAYTFFKAQGYEVGKSICELDKLELATQLMQKAEKNNVKLLLPIDTKVGKEFKPDTESKTVKCTQIPAEWEGFDIGEETIKMFSEELKRAKTVVWNGPLGLFEFDQFAIGTNEIAKVLSQIDATTIIGGGDSAAAVKKAGLEDKMTHISVLPFPAETAAKKETFSVYLSPTLPPPPAGSSGNRQTDKEKGILSLIYSRLHCCSRHQNIRAM